MFRFFYLKKNSNGVSLSTPPGLSFKQSKRAIHKNASKNSLHCVGMHCDITFKRTKRDFSFFTVINWSTFLSQHFYLANINLINL